MENPSINQLVEYVTLLSPEILGRVSTDEVQLTQLAGGHHNVNFLIDIGDPSAKRYVLRFHPSDQDGNDVVAAEYAQLKKLNGLLAPKAIHLGKPDFLSSSVMIMEFVPGVHKSYSDLNPSEIRQLANGLATIHLFGEEWYQSHPEEVLRLGTYMDAAHAVITAWTVEPLAKIARGQYPEATLLVQMALTRLEADLKRESAAFAGVTRSLIHSDPNPENVIWHEKGITFVDWSGAGIGDPADEISFMFVGNAVSDEFKWVFMEEYLGLRPDASLPVRIEVYVLKSLIEDLVWVMSQLERERLGTLSRFLTREEGTYQRHFEIRFQALRGYMEY